MCDSASFSCAHSVETIRLYIASLLSKSLIYAFFRARNARADSLFRRASLLADLMPFPEKSRNLPASSLSVGLKTTPLRGKALQGVPGPDPDPDPDRRSAGRRAGPAAASLQSRASFGRGRPAKRGAGSAALQPGSAGMKSHPSNSKFHTGTLSNSSIAGVKCHFYSIQRGI